MRQNLPFSQHANFLKWRNRTDITEILECLE